MQGLNGTEFLIKVKEINKSIVTVLMSAGNDNDKISMTHTVFLRYMSDGFVHSGVLTIEIKYSFSRCSINYLDVQYSDPQIRKHVEGNPNALRIIDSHLRNNLFYQEYSIN